MPSPANTRPRLSTVVTPGVNGGKADVSTKEKYSISNPIIAAADIAPKGVIDLAQLVRVLNLLQDPSNQATAPAQSNPFWLKCVLQSVPLTGGVQADLKHTLAAQWRYVWIVSAAAGSAACTLARVTSPALDQSQYCSIVPTGTGVYDICICPL